MDGISQIGRQLLQYSPNGLPDNLYRVTYPGSQTAYSAESGLSAIDTTATFDLGTITGQYRFKLAVENQFTWSNRQPSTLISLFSSSHHALEWARKEPWRRRGRGRGQEPQDGWTLQVVETYRLEATTKLYRLRDLVRLLDVEIYGGAREHIDGAVVCMHRVPADAIRDSLTIEHSVLMDADKLQVLGSLLCPPGDVSSLLEDPSSSPPPPLPEGVVFRPRQDVTNLASVFRQGRFYRWLYAMLEPESTTPSYNPRSQQETMKARACWMVSYDLLQSLINGEIGEIECALRLSFL
ncbi:hypothetical protein MKZ38_002862 [Zalerion maritima]|uniref:DUF7587 domain-containing protein n=1 Tax=Zalerion maritima TaxID=339359 RepID=A0AAD5WXQ3_9PEZI|nr:hypothetical protein MKZ38_002862 [Zalerion maritima]